VVVKLRHLASVPTLAKLSLLLTLIAILPSMAITLYLSHSASSPSNAQNRRRAAPTASLLNLSLFSCSMAFFLFSFQVHEKSILLPLLPLTLIMADKEPPASDWAWGMLVNNVAVFRCVRS
jgi:alpha-1,3-glucosyltransferase